jgi:hypothetical protein
MSQNRNFKRVATYVSLQEADTCIPEVQLVANAYNVYIAGPDWKAIQTFFLIRDKFQTLGLHLNPNKCETYGPTPTIASIIAVTCDILHAKDGITVLGSPVGTAAYVRNTIRP